MPMDFVFQEISKSLLRSKTRKPQFSTFPLDPFSDEDSHCQSAGAHRAAIAERKK
jgi:hypothetical protein